MDENRLLQKLLHGELTHIEEAQFITYIETDKDFSEQAKIVSLMHAYRAKELEKYFLADHSNKNKPANNSQATLSKMIRNVAAVFILAAVSYFSFNYIEQKNNVFVVNDYLNKPLISPGLAQSSSEGESAWQQAIVFYSDMNYEQAELELNKIDDLNVEQKLYLGLSKMYKNPGAFVEAIEIFELIRDDPDNLNQDATQWYLAIAYIKSGQKDLARPILEAISLSNHYRHKQAKEVLKYFDGI